MILAFVDDNFAVRNMAIDLLGGSAEDVREWGGPQISRIAINTRLGQHPGLRPKVFPSPGGRAAGRRCRGCEG
jgi:hypothetical protein